MELSHDRFNFYVAVAVPCSSKYDHHSSTIKTTFTVQAVYCQSVCSRGHLDLVMGPITYKHPLQKPGTAACRVRYRLVMS